MDQQILLASEEAVALAVVLEVIVKLTPFEIALTVGKPSVPDELQLVSWITLFVVTAVVETVAVPDDNVTDPNHEAPADVVVAAVPLILPLKSIVWTALVLFWIERILPAVRVFAVLMMTSLLADAAICVPLSVIPAPVVAVDVPELIDTAPGVPFAVVPEPPGPAVMVTLPPLPPLFVVPKLAAPPVPAAIENEPPAPPVLVPAAATLAAPPLPSVKLVFPPTPPVPAELTAAPPVPVEIAIAPDAPPVAPKL